MSCEPTSSEISFFLQQGFLKVENFLSTGEVDEVLQHYDQEVAGYLRQMKAQETMPAAISLESEFNDMMQRQLRENTPRLVWLPFPERRRPEILAAKAVSRSREWACSLLETKDVKVSTRIWHKPPNRGAPVMWHQDEAFRDPAVIGHSLNVWIALDPAPIERGCLHFLPGSQKGEVVEHEAAGVSLRAVGIDTQEAVPCPLPTGGASFHHCRTLHCSGPNLTDSPRRGFVIVCEGPPSPRIPLPNWPWKGA